MSIDRDRTTADPRAARRIGVVAALLGAAALALFWPGYLAYDSVAQYHQALSGAYDDWHPPVMARLWSLFGGIGPGPLLALQMIGYWLGFGSLATALTVRGRPGAAGAALFVALWPPLLGWQAVVLKDAQMLGALFGAVGLLAWFRLRDRPVPRAVWTCASLLLAYAVLVRANAVFAVVPLAVMLTQWPRRWLARLVTALGGIALVIAVSGPINHRLMAAAASGVERTQAIYDLVGIGVRTDDPRVGLSPTTLAALRAKRCSRPFFWDPLGEPTRCAAEVADLQQWPAGRLYLLLAGAALRHPLAYAGHRLGHLNSTERWLVPWHWLGAAPPQMSEPNTLGVGEPGHAAHVWQGIAGWLVETPLGWPILWLVLGLGGLWVTRRADDEPARLARALFVSAVSLECSFAAISIASDLRYHVWTMAAVAIGWILFGTLSRNRLLWAAVAVVIVGGCAARIALPEAPQTYRGMLG